MVAETSNRFEALEECYEFNLAHEEQGLPVTTAMSPADNSGNSCIGRSKPLTLTQNCATTLPKEAAHKGVQSRRSWPC